MRCASIVLTLLAVALPAIARASTVFDIEGSILRLDNSTCRIQFGISMWADSCSQEPRPPDPDTPVAVWITDVLVTGGFGMASNVRSSTYPPFEVFEDRVRWVSNEHNYISAQFDFETLSSQPTQLFLEFSGRSEPWWTSCTNNVCGRVTCGDELFSRALHAAVPTGVGDSTSLEPYVAVENATWSQVKRLFR
jgi:hypothetical protein